MPQSILPGGIYYSEDLFKEAGVTETPTDMASLNDAVSKLKAAGTSPVALGAKDAWPAAHWYYFFALRECSKDAIDQAAESRSFDDDCFLKAGQDLQDFAETEPFNDGYLTTSAQQGAGSSAGLIANHQAAMELMGAWDPGVIKDLTPTKEPPRGPALVPLPGRRGRQG